MAPKFKANVEGPSVRKGAGMQCSPRSELSIPVSRRHVLSCGSRIFIISNSSLPIPDRDCALFSILRCRTRNLRTQEQVRVARSSSQKSAEEGGIRKCKSSSDGELRYLKSFCRFWKALFRSFLLESRMTRFRASELWSQIRFDHADRYLRDDSFCRVRRRGYCRVES